MKLHEVGESLDVTRCNLSGSTFNDVNLSNTTLENVNLSGGRIEDAGGDDDQRYSGHRSAGGV
jgi:uncharacterized protein YjbI with pentapeptide repeats